MNNDNINIRLDVHQYKEKKEKGLIAVAKLGDAYAISIKRFSPETGEPENAQVIGIDLALLEAQKVRLQKMIDDIEEIIKDLKALNQES